MNSGDDPFQRRKGLPQYPPTIDPEPAVEYRGIESAEIRVESRGVLVEIYEARVLSYQPAFDSSAGQEHWRGGAVVGTTPSVFRQAPAELREGHHQHGTEESVVLEVGGKGGY